MFRRFRGARFRSVAVSIKHWQQLWHDCLVQLQQQNAHWQATHQRGTRTNFQYNGSFHEAVAPVLLMGQCFCLLPVRGICSVTPQNLCFTWQSWRSWYSIAYMCATMLNMAFIYLLIIDGSVDIAYLESILSHLSILTISMSFLQLARKWPMLMQEWDCVERQLPTYETAQQQRQLAQRIRRVLFVLSFMSLMEHLLDTLLAIHLANYCPVRKDATESYFYSLGNHIFHVLPYSIWLGLLAKLQHVLLSCSWSFVEIFIIAIGIGLTELLARLTRQLQLQVQQPRSETYWLQVRTQFWAIVELIDRLNDAMSTILLVAFASNMYFLCMQLLKAINRMPSFAHGAYFYYSLIFLVIRFMAVLIYTSAINDRAQEALQLLRLVPNNAYHEQVARFAMELSMVIDDIALNAHRFFTINRKLVLTVAGTVLTYELVLIQFYESKLLWSCTMH